MTAKEQIEAFFIERTTAKAKDVKANFPDFTSGQIAGAIYSLAKAGKIKCTARGCYEVAVNGAGKPTE